MQPAAVPASMSEGVNVANAERGVADRRRQRIEHDGDHRGEVADPEQHDHRDQVDEARQGLQRVDDRLRRRARSGGERPPMMPIGMPISRGDDHRDAAQIDGHHRVLPLAGERDEQREARRRAPRDARPPRRQPAKASSGDHQRPGLGDHEPLDRHEHVEQERALDRLDGVEEIDVDPPYRLAPPRRGRELQRRWIDRHRREANSPRT